MPINQFSFTALFNDEKTTVVTFPSLTSIIEHASSTDLVSASNLSTFESEAPKHTPMGTPINIKREYAKSEPLNCQSSESPHLRAADMISMDPLDNEGSYSVGSSVMRRMSPYPMESSARGATAGMSNAIGLVHSPITSRSAHIFSPTSTPTRTTVFEYADNDLHRRKVKLKDVETRWFSFSALGPLHSPPEHPRGPTNLRHNVLFIYIDEAAKQENIDHSTNSGNRPSALKWMRMWVWDGLENRWEDIHYGDERIVNGHRLSLSLFQSGETPEWITPKAMKQKFRSREKCHSRRMDFVMELNDALTESWNAWDIVWKDWSSSMSALEIQVEQDSADSAEFIRRTRKLLARVNSMKDYYQSWMDDLHNTIRSHTLFQREDRLLTKIADDLQLLIARDLLLQAQVEKSFD
ncbi:hypothetical protein GYMLUDRAFT_61808 [Collybiopsis luxurians FD-317 M1]|uniref:Unplaced genomic scaffold GYMLUscaffold_47, whole genome shotgun sequence n=1 Tax=Collybiopsis luxurians FD-317 M1 TaxID=944289 RepID=A0A0D0CF99_9AGAR|nr:hypothetical protein GYMLUDRAFT_61808 [Collybiopsis luxurians FD-317 M1]